MYADNTCTVLIYLFVCLLYLISVGSAFAIKNYCSTMYVS